jgi:transposase
MSEKKWTWRPKDEREEQNARLLQALLEGLSYRKAALRVGMKPSSVAGVVRDARRKGFDLPPRVKKYRRWGRRPVRAKPEAVTEAT